MAQKNFKLRARVNLMIHQPSNLPPSRSSLIRRHSHKRIKDSKLRQRLKEKARWISAARFCPSCAEWRNARGFARNGRRVTPSSNSSPMFQKELEKSLASERRIRDLTDAARGCL
jgi:hypothetical protein